jgi:hypothetical protein
MAEYMTFDLGYCGPLDLIVEAGSICESYTEAERVMGAIMANTTIDAVELVF